MKELLKSTYKAVPFKRPLFSVLRLLPVPHSIYQHLHFRGPVRVHVDCEHSFKIQHYGFAHENELFWAGIEGCWEKSSLEVWSQLARRSQVIFDIGANSGIYSLVAKCVHPEATVIGFEPVRQLHHRFLKNCEMNDFDIEAVPAAVSDHDGSTRIFLPTGMDHFYSASLNSDFISNICSNTSEEVRVVRLSSFIEEHKIDRLDLVKIDVETFEPQVLRGMGKYLSAFKPAIFIEILTDEIALEIEALVSNLGYIYFDFDEVTGPRRIDRIGKSSKFNILMITLERAREVGLVVEEKSANPNVPDSGGSFLDATFSGGALSVVKLLTGFFRSKYVALSVGLAGVGLISQGTQLQLLLCTLGTLGISTAIVNVYNDPKLTPVEKEQCLRTALTVQLGSAFAWLVFSLWKLQGIATFSGASSDEARLFIPVLLSLPMMVAVVGYLDPILIATGRYKDWVRVSIVSGILGFVSFMILVGTLGISGAFYGLLSTPVISMICYLTVFRGLQKKSTTGPLFPGLFRFGFSLKMFRTFLKISFVTLLPAILSYFLMLALRGKLVSLLGAEANGLQQVPFAMTAYLTPFLTNALWGRLQPMVSATGDSPLARKELGFVLRFTLIATTAFATGMMVFSAFFVRFAYSSQFLPATRLVPFQLTGDFFYFLAFPLSIYFLGISRLRDYLLGWLVYYAGYALFCWALIPRLGLLALPMGYIAASVIGSTFTFGWYLSKTSIADRRQTLRVFVPCLIAVLGQVFLTTTDVSSYLRFAVFFGTASGGAFYLFRKQLAAGGFRSLFNRLVDRLGQEC
jgi:FkbM family methyltransferase